MLKIAFIILLLMCSLVAPSAHNVSAMQVGPTDGWIPAPPPNTCILGQTQHPIEVGAQRPCDTTFTEIGVSSTPGVNLYVRFGQPVTMEAGKVVADYRVESSSPFKLIVLEPPHPGGTYYVALTNCGPTDAHYSLRFAAYVVDYFGPVIKSASVKGKKLFVSGCQFGEDSVIVLDGQDLATQQIEREDMPTLLNRKAAKKTARKDSVSLEVRDSFGRLSPPFTFINPDK